MCTKLARGTWNVAIDIVKIEIREINLHTRKPDSQSKLNHMNDNKV